MVEIFCRVHMRIYVPSPFGLSTSPKRETEYFIAFEKVKRLENGRRDTLCCVPQKSLEVGARGRHLPMSSSFVLLALHIAENAERPLDASAGVGLSGQLDRSYRYNAATRPALLTSLHQSHRDNIVTQMVRRYLPVGAFLPSGVWHSS